MGSIFEYVKNEKSYENDILNPNGNCLGEFGSSSYSKRKKDKFGTRSFLTRKQENMQGWISVCA